ncbi:MAG: fructose 1,6-bisphosphatase, partial [Candidatus Bathyarchaeia archaeon]
SCCRLLEHAILFEDSAFVHAKKTALQMAEFIRRNGPIAPAILGMEELEYTGIVETLKKLQSRFFKI